MDLRQGSVLEYTQVLDFRRCISQSSIQRWLYQPLVNNNILQGRIIDEAEEQKPRFGPVLLSKNCWGVIVARPELTLATNRSLPARFQRTKP